MANLRLTFHDFLRKSKVTGSSAQFAAKFGQIMINMVSILDPEVMSFASKFYKSARSAVLWNLPFMKDMRGFFSDQIQVVKDVVERRQFF